VSDVPVFENAVVDMEILWSSHGPGEALRIGGYLNLLAALDKGRSCRWALCNNVNKGEVIGHDILLEPKIILLFSNFLCNFKGPHSTQISQALSRGCWRGSTAEV
jgi:hypothetical protein